MVVDYVIYFQIWSDYPTMSHAQFAQYRWTSHDEAVKLAQTDTMTNLKLSLKDKSTF